jgi:hypothetical protein
MLQLYAHQRFVFFQNPTSLPFFDSSHGLSFNTITNALTLALQSINKQKNIQCCYLKFFERSQHKQILFFQFLSVSIILFTPLYIFVVLNGPNIQAGERFAWLLCREIDSRNPGLCSEHDCWILIYEYVNIKIILLLFNYLHTHKIAGCSIDHDMRVSSFSTSFFETFSSRETISKLHAKDTRRT